MKKLLLLLILLPGLIFTGCAGDGGTANVPVPSLEELSGRYADGTITFDKVYISEELLAAAQKKADDAAANADEDDPFDQIDVIGAGCDIDMMRMLMSYEGQTMENPFVISLVKETEGTLQFEGDDEEEDIEIDTEEVLTFSYSPDSGVLSFTKVPEGMKLAKSLSASYLEDSRVAVSGTLRLTTAEESESNFYIDLTIAGTKPSNGQ